jgi:hypothetical protein
MSQLKQKEIAAEPLLTDFHDHHYTNPFTGAECREMIPISHLLAIAAY